MKLFKHLTTATIEVAVAVVVVAIMATTTTAVVAAEEAATPSAEEMVRSTVTQVSSGSSPRPKTQLSQQLQPLTTLEPLITSLQRVTPVTLSKEVYIVSDCAITHPLLCRETRVYKIHCFNSTLYLSRFKDFK